MKTSGIEIIPKVCAACDKSGEDLKACTKCEQVYYCNNKCRKAHLQKHKKECRRYTAELHNSSNNDTLIDVLTEQFSKVVISDDELFQDPAPKEDCPICFQPLPFSSGICGVSRMYKTCCGKVLCNGCSNSEFEEVQKGNLKECCAFCRASSVTAEEQMKRLKIRLGQNDHEAWNLLGFIWRDGKWGNPQDLKRALESWHRAAELGSPSARSEIGTAYRFGRGIEKNMKKAMHHLKLAAIGGDEMARRNLGLAEREAGNIDRSMKHYMIAARSGDDKSLKEVGEGFKKGHITKDDYACTLRAYKESKDEMKSDQRERSQNSEWEKSAQL